MPSTADADTASLLQMDGAIGPWLFDAAPGVNHPTLVGDAAIAPAAESRREDARQAAAGA